MRLEFEPNVTTFPLVENELFEGAAYNPGRDFDALLKKGVAAAQTGDRESARALLTEASEIEPRNEDAWMWLASISDYPEELLAFLNNVLDINPENKRAIEWLAATRSLLAKNFVQKAVSAHDEGSDALASQCLEHALEYDNNCEKAWFLKASFATNNDQKAEFFQKVLDINPENTEALDTLNAIKASRLQNVFEAAKQAAINGESEKAIELVDEFLKAVPDHVDAWILRSHLSPGMNEKRRCLESALQIDPDNAAARSGYDFISATINSMMPPPVVADHEATEFALRPTDEKIAVADVLEEAQPAMESASAALEASEDNEPAAEYVTEAGYETFINHQASHVAGDESPEVQNAHDEFSDQNNFEASYEPEEQVSFVAPNIEEPQVVYETQMDFVAPSENNAPIAFEAWMTLETPPVPAQPEDEPESEFRSGVRFTAIEEFADPESNTVESFDPVTENTVAETPAIEEVPQFSPDLTGTDATVSFEKSARSVEFRLDPIYLQPAVQPTGSPCPFCASLNEVQAFHCGSCGAALSLSDVESLLSNHSADRDVIQLAVTEMEAEWNLREFSETELTFLGIGHLNLNNLDAGLKYLQEALRLNPNNVVLASHVNTIAIRLDEIRRQNEVHNSMPRGKNILVVDDSPTVRKLISGKLEKSGHNVVCAVDGVEALERLAENLPDLVLLDITMPRMDGYEVCKQIRANPAAKNLPVVMISGKDGFFDKVRGRMAGTSGYVTKPFGPETLMKALETYLLPDVETVH